MGNGVLYLYDRWSDEHSQPHCTKVRTDVKDFSAYLDVLPQESPENHPLLEAWRMYSSWLNERLIINPHNAYYSDVAFVDVKISSYDTIINALQHNLYRNVVNDVNKRRI